MPVAVRNSPFDNDSNKQQESPTEKHKLKVPQVRVLAALMPEDATWPQSEWPLITRTYLNEVCGYSQISTGVTRPMQGIPSGSSSGKSYPGLIALKYVDEIVLDVDGVQEVNYRATLAGALAYLEWAATNNNSKKLARVKDRESCINDRYKK